MATTTITITSATNPTYGGHILNEAGAYSRTTLDSGDPNVLQDGATFIQRVFAFFDLSTDPTSGGTITKVELLATVNSVSGTHAVDIVGGDFSGLYPDVASGIAATDAEIYGNCIAGNFNVNATTTPSSGAVAIDLGAEGITGAVAGITNVAGFFAGIALSNEAAAGSVVFDAATGFGLRITYTPVATGFNAMMMTGAGA